MTTYKSLPDTQRSFNSLPGPRGIPFFGNLLQIEADRMHQQLEHWCEVYGPVFRLRLGPRRVVVLGDHQLIANALRDRPDGFRRTTRFEQVWTEMGLLGGVFGATGDEWRRQRRMVMASFDPGHVKRFYPSLQKVGRRLVARWQDAARDGSIIDLQADLMRFTVDAVAGLAFGADVNTLQSDEDVIQKHLGRIFPALFNRIFAPLPVWRWLPSAADRELRLSVAAVNTAVDEFIAQARQRLKSEPGLRENPENLLEAMLVAADEPDSGIDDKQVAGNVLVMLLAGEDTTANTLAWMVWLLSRHPAAMARARDEVRGACRGDTPTMEELAQLDYVEAVAHEAMRLKPVAPHNAMEALRDTVLGDVKIEAGMIIFAAMRHDAVNECLIPNAMNFNPERWLVDGSATANSAKRISMPFGAGPRICPGRYLALLEIKLAMAVTLANFDILEVSTPDGGEPRELLQLAMGPVGLRMRLRERVAHADVVN